MASKVAVENFLKCKNIAVVGVSRKSSKFGNVIVVMQAMQICRCVPGGAGSQLISLKQNAIGPSEFRQMVKDGAANQTTSDNNSSLNCVLFNMILSWEK